MAYDDASTPAGAPVSNVSAVPPAYANQPYPPANGGYYAVQPQQQAGGYYQPQPQQQVGGYYTNAVPGGSYPIGTIPYSNAPTTVVIQNNDYLVAQRSQPTGSLFKCCASNRGGDFDFERAVFVRKVLLIVCAQLMVVAAMSALFYSVTSIREYMVTYGWTFWLLAIILEVVFLVLLLVARKRKPLAALFLFGFTVSSGYFVAMFVCYFDIYEIIEAVVITFAVVVVCVVYTMITRADFRWLIIVILALVIAMMFWSLTFCFSYYYYYEDFVWYYQVYTLIGILVFVCYLLFDMSLIVNKYPTDEHMLAAVNLYLDIITVFIYILSFLGNRR